MSKFVHLHTHSHYSLLDGLSQIDEMISLAQKFQMPTLAITDHGNLYGAIEFYKKAKKVGIKPIIGVEAYIASRSRKDKEAGVDDRRFHLTLLAKNETGYRNLIKLVTVSFLEGFYYKPRMDYELLEKYHEGLICLSGCFSSELSRALRQGNPEKAERVIKEHQEIFSRENYFLEIMHHPGVEGLGAVQKVIVELSGKLKIPLVATQDSHYLLPTDQKAHETLLAIQTTGDITDETRLSMAHDDFSFIGSNQATTAFSHLPEALENTLAIASQCNLELKFGDWVFPEYKIAAGTTHDQELKRLVYQGLKEKNLEPTKEVEERISYELGIISRKGFAPYFLVVADILRFARGNKILTNTRGSVAGSLVSYLTSITNINPLDYKLPFERFLNPDRPSAPDIDMDFADDRRDEVIEYARKKYGEDKVAQIGTFGTMMARGVVRDVARALGHPYGLGDRISRLIPFGSQGFPMTIDRAMKLEPELARMSEQEPEVKEILDLGQRLEGCARHISVHAAGVVISPKPLDELVPLQFDPEARKVITQYDMHAVEDVGLLKFDFLGIRNLAILADAVERVKKIRELEIEIEKIPLDDKKTFQMLSRGETMGVFQLASSGMTRWLKELKPNSIHDINAVVALYRPGPMESIPEYIRRKHNPKLVSFLDPRMKEILDQSYGVIVYQDDVLLIAVKLAGYSWLEADKLRKAMGKKIPAEMEAQKEKLIKGFIENGATQKKAEEFWHLITPFAAYGFNKAHAASYGRLAYQTAYMKANFPAEYMSAVLTAEAGDLEKAAEIIEECKRLGFEVLPPDINESFSDFTVVRNERGAITNKIRFGLRSIKNFGEEIGKAIIHERRKAGPYKSYSDFLERVKHKNLNKKSLEALIRSGALESLGERGQLLANLEEALEYSRELSKGTENQASLFGLMSDKTSLPNFRLKEAPAATIEEKLLWEKELLGLYISGHPLEKFREKLQKHNQNIKKIKENETGGPVIIAGILDEIKTKFTKNGTKMAFAKLTDFTGSIELVVFPDSYETARNLLHKNNCVVVRGSVSHRSGQASIIIEKVKLLEESDAGIIKPASR